MFENLGFTKPLNEDRLLKWLEKGRESLIVYKYLMIIWNEFDNDFKPLYLEGRDEIEEYRKQNTSNASETLVAVYDVFSESRISLKNN